MKVTYMSHIIAILGGVLGCISIAILQDKKTIKKTSFAVQYDNTIQMDYWIIYARLNFCKFTVEQ